MLSLDICKSVSDYLRKTYGIKSGHAHELTVAFFGYGSRAALLADRDYDIGEIENGEVMVPDIKLIERRRVDLVGLPAGVLPTSEELAEEIGDFLQSNGFFNGEIWYCENIGDHMLEGWLDDNVSADLDDYLSSEIASTNAYFDDPYYEKAVVDKRRRRTIVTVSGVYSGTTEEDKLFCGDEIDMRITVELPRVAGRTVFAKPEINVVGQVNDDYAEDYDYSEASA